MVVLLSMAACFALPETRKPPPPAAPAQAKFWCTQGGKCHRDKAVCTRTAGGLFGDTVQANCTPSDQAFCAVSDSGSCYLSDADCRRFHGDCAAN